ncbi:hypothetical protein HanIR_Chr03g0121841 [Helianthus annuus]|nr:hypothetical protein HanIR_Chr03g0121841 [Helianthus annuus]
MFIQLFFLHSGYSIDRSSPSRVSTTLNRLFIVNRSLFSIVPLTIAPYDLLLQQVASGAILELCLFAFLLLISWILNGMLENWLC